MKKFVVTISREYASGGRSIGYQVAEKLGVKCYNNSLIDMVAKESGLHAEYINRHEEHISSPIIMGVPLPRSNMSYAGVTKQNYYINENKMFAAQSKIIKDITEKESCVIVGRLADYLLKDHENRFSVFVYASMEDRVMRAMEIYNYAKKDEAKKAIIDMDKNRTNYHRKYADKEWRDCHNYHIMLNSSLIGIDGCAEIVSDYVFKNMV